jgi:ferredoxin
MPEGWMRLIRSQVPALPVERRTGISQVDLGYSEDEARLQGLRCLQCSTNTIFDGSQCILCNGCVDVCPWDCLKIVRADSLAGDERVARLLEAGPGAPSAIPRLPDQGHGRTVPGVDPDSTRRAPTAAMIKDDNACTRCGLCAERCPTGAITMESFRFKEALVYEDSWLAELWKIQAGEAGQGD